MIWGHAIGVYLLAGVVLNGLGHLVRARWIASGQMKPLNLAPGRKWILPVAIAASTILWPLFLVTISIGWRIRRKTRKLEETLGYCAHANQWMPICNACRREIEREKKEGAAISSYIVGRRPGSPSAEDPAVGAFLDTSGRRPLISKAAEEYTKSILAKMGRRPQAPERGAQDSPGVGGPGGVPALPDPQPLLPAIGASAEGSVYRCSACGVMSEGLAPGSTPEGWPLCPLCCKPG